MLTYMWSIICKKPNYLGIYVWLYFPVLYLPSGLFLFLFFQQSSQPNQNQTALEAETGTPFSDLTGEYPDL